MNHVSDAPVGVPNLVHIGLVVEGLDEAVRFLSLLDFDCGQPAVFSGECREPSQPPTCGLQSRRLAA